MQFRLLGCWDNEGDKEGNDGHPEHLLSLKGAKNIHTDCTLSDLSHFLRSASHFCFLNPEFHTKFVPWVCRQPHFGCFKGSLGWSPDVWAQTVVGVNTFATFRLDVRALG